MLPSGDQSVAAIANHESLQVRVRKGILALLAVNCSTVELPTGLGIISFEAASTLPNLPCKRVPDTSLVLPEATLSKETAAGGLPAIHPVWVRALARVRPGQPSRNKTHLQAALLPCLFGRLQK